MLRLPWGLSGKESTFQYRRHRFDPWSRKIPHALREVGPRATTIELMLQLQRPAHPGAHAPQQEKPL